MHRGHDMLQHPTSTSLTILSIAARVTPALLTSTKLFLYLYITAGVLSTLRGVSLT